MKIKRITILILIFTILFTTFSFGADLLIDVKDNEQSSTEAKDDLNIYSEAVILIENKTGKTLYEKNSEQKMYPASTTKILTAILAIEKGNLQDNVTVTKSALAQMKAGYSSAYLSEGEIMSVENLLTVLLVHSANDASNVLAEYISGSIDEFVNLMNEKVKELGCNNTHFVTTNGLHDDNHYTTAKDLCTIARYCMKNSTFRKFVSMRSCKIPATNKSAERYYKNTNDLLNTTSAYYYPSCIGIKTGYTSEAKNCLISACNKNGLQTIAVVLGAGVTENNKSARYVDSKTLYDYAYSNYAIETVAKSSSILGTTDVKKATKETKSLDLLLENDITALVNKSNKSKINYELHIDENLSAPIAANSVVGTVTYNIEGIEYTSNLIASHAVEKTHILIIILRIVLVIVILTLILFIIKYILKNKRNKR